MRQVGAMVGNIVDIEKPGAGNVRLLVFRLCIAVDARQEVGGVKDPQVRIIEMRRQPIGGYQCFRIVVCHDSPLKPLPMT